MKGVVFTEFLDMVESLFSADMVDDIIEDCTLKSSGTYTSVGTYDYEELLLLVTALSKRSDLAVKELVQKYGHHLFFRFHDMFPVFLKNKTLLLSFWEAYMVTYMLRSKNSILMRLFQILKLRM